LRERGAERSEERSCRSSLKRYKKKSCGFVDFGRFCPNTKREKDLNCDGKGDIYVKKKDFAVNK
jgi:hypothetical protein